MSRTSVQLAWSLGPCRLEESRHAGNHDRAPARYRLRLPGSQQPPLGLRRRCWRRRARDDDLRLILIGPLRGVENLFGWIDDQLPGPHVAVVGCELLRLKQLFLGSGPVAVAVLGVRVRGDRCSTEVLDPVLHCIQDREDDLFDPLLLAESLGQDFPGSFGCCAGLLKKLPPAFWGWLGDAGSLADLLCHMLFVPS